MVDALSELPGEALDVPGDTKPLIEFRTISTLVFAKLLPNDEVTCIVVHSHSVLVGTRQGSVLRVDPSGTKAAVVSSHEAGVYSISVDAEGRFVASGAADGRVIVAPITGNDAVEPWISEGTHSILSVALCPEFASASSDNRTVCAGTEDGRLLLHKRGVFRGENVIHSGEGPVRKVSWKGRLVAWANNKGVKVFNVNSGQKVTFVAKPPAADASTRCCLTWGSEDRLLMAFGTTVKIAIFVNQPEKGIGSVRAEVRYQFNCLDLVCGFASAGGQNIAILTSSQRTGAGARANLLLCNLAGEVFHSTSVPLAPATNAGAQNVHLGFIAPHLPMYLSAPREVLSFTTRDLLEHAAWLLEQGLYEDVVKLANGGGEGVPGLRHFCCVKCVVADLRKSKFEHACEVICSFRDLEGTTWQECIHLFDNFGGLQHLAASIPVPKGGEGLRLPNEVYDAVLHRLVASPSCLLTVLRFWPSDIFSIPGLQEKLRESLPGALDRAVDFSPDDRYRAECLALLDVEVGEISTAVWLFLQLDSPEVFKLLRSDFTSRKSLVEVVQTNIVRLFHIDNKEACTFLVEFYTTIAVDSVVSALHGCENRWRHEYLKQLFAKDEVAGQEYHMQMVRLFAEYEPKGLLGFLRASERYPLRDALGVCQQRGFHEEEAYLLRREGRVEEALAIHLETLGDVQGAVRFAAEYQDPKLWDDLVKYVLEHPDLLVTLLECLEELETDSAVGQDSGRAQQPHTATPGHVLKNLPPETQVLRVASSIQKVFDSEELHVGLHTSCRKLVNDEMLVNKKRFVDSHQRGAAITPGTWKCTLCGRSMNRPPPDPPPPAPASSDGRANPLLGAPGAAVKGSGGIVIHGRQGFHQSCYQRWLKIQKPRTDSTPTPTGAHLDGLSAPRRFQDIN